MERIAVIGLGYVGLPLAVEFGKKREVIGFDIDLKRIEDLKKEIEKTGEVSKDELSAAKFLRYTNHEADLKSAEIYIITVPTPIDEFKKPDLQPLIHASKIVGNVIEKGNIIIYESTVFPGCTEEVCVPILERESKLKFNINFFCGYSPERINPGDKQHRLPNIIKITSGSNPEVAEKVDQLYASIITAGTHKASSIKVAEAAKVIENAQRDLNIAFVNELSMIFERMEISTQEVLDAAKTKWNFLPFKPGLVGGHCIGVDPYYLTYKAQSLGYHPEIILAGRKINDNMGVFVANKVIKLMSQNGNKIKGSKALILGITFKENCPDIRNSKVIDVIRELESYGVDIDVYDPHADSTEVNDEYNIELKSAINGETYDVIILAVAHNEFKTLNLEKFKNDKSIVYDIKGFTKDSIVNTL